MAFSRYNTGLIRYDFKKDGKAMFEIWSDTVNRKWVIKTLKSQGATDITYYYYQH